jgi:putative transposase
MSAFHLPSQSVDATQAFRRREGAMARFRDLKTLQIFAAVHASVQNHFYQQRHLTRRDIYKTKRAAALSEWRQLAA